MNKVTRRGVWLASLLLVVAALTAVTALHGTTPTTTFAPDSKHHPTPTPTPTMPTPTPTSTPLMITTTSLPNGNVCASYTVFITANKGGGFSLDTWTIVSGALPAGLTMATSYGIEPTVVFSTPTTLAKSAVPGPASDG